jgi:hypothetical protein
MATKSKSKSTAQTLVAQTVEQPNVEAIVEAIESINEAAIEPVVQANVEVVAIEPVVQANVEAVAIEPVVQANVEVVAIKPVVQANVEAESVDVCDINKVLEKIDTSLEVLSVVQQKVVEQAAPSKMAVATSIFEEELAAKGREGMVRKEILQRFMAEANLTPAGANTYYNNFRTKHGFVKSTGSVAINITAVDAANIVAAAA